MTRSWGLLRVRWKKTTREKGHHEQRVTCEKRDAVVAGTNKVSVKPGR